MAGDLVEVQELVEELAVGDVRALAVWLAEYIEGLELAEELQKKPASVHQARAYKIVGATVYQNEMISCGKCKRCKAGHKAHGPYWYGYARCLGQMKSWYCGRTLKTMAGEPVVGVLED